jgi:hypothetical protein
VSIAASKLAFSTAGNVLDFSHGTEPVTALQMFVIGTNAGNFYQAIGQPVGSTAFFRLSTGSP